jgi:hypothetical protein
MLMSEYDIIIGYTDIIVEIICITNDILPLLIDIVVEITAYIPARRPVVLVTRRGH